MNTMIDSYLVHTGK